MIRCVVIEDEPNNQELFRMIIKNHLSGLELVGVAGNVHDGIGLVKKSNPDLIFLDIEMPDGNGFDVLNALSSRQAKVIFVTGYDQYAIKAIKYAAFDYLLKPIDLDEIKSCIDRLKQSLVLPENHSGMARYEQSVTEQIILYGHDSYRVLERPEIEMITSERSYTSFYLVTGSEYSSSRPLAHFEERVIEWGFYRVHKSHIVNCEHVKLVSTGRGGRVLMKSGREIPIAFRRKAAFVELLRSNNRLQYG